MNDDDKRELARLLAPHLAWDLTRSDVYQWNPSATASGVAGEVFAQQILSMLRYNIHSGKAFTVAIIPAKNSGDDLAVGDIIVDDTRGLGPRFMPHGLNHEGDD